MSTALVSYAPLIAIIDEQQCIGCTLCIKACPFDAILGANKHMHTVINAYCTGCELCIAPCPMDCIIMQSNPIVSESHTHAAPEYSSHNACTQCGQCQPVCPSYLNPASLYEMIRQTKLHQAKASRLDACSLCGECSNVCPSHIPLAETFRYAISLLTYKANKKTFAIDCKQRAHNKKNRLEIKSQQQQALLTSNKHQVAAKLQALKNIKK